MNKVDTTDWTVDEHIAYNRQLADSARQMARMVLGWQLDVLGTYAGTVEVVPWPEIEDEDIWDRNRKPVERDPSTRVIHANGFAYLVRDVA